MDELNKLPIDAGWLKQVEASAAQAAHALGCMVVLVAVQEHGKLAVEFSGVPDSGPLHEIAQDAPRMLATLAQVCALQDAQLRKNKQ